MRVWVVEQGMYSDRGVIGVYATADAAIAAVRTPGDTWKQWDDCDIWSNGRDWQGAITVTPFDLQGAVVVDASH